MKDKNEMQILQPAGWPRPKGYANGIVGEGRIVFVAGQIGWNEQNRFERKDFAGQLDQALANTMAVLAEAGAEARHIARMTWYVTDRAEYLANTRQVGAVFRAHMGGHYPVMSVVEVSALMEEEAKVEVESTAVLPRE